MSNTLSSPGEPVYVPQSSGMSIRGSEPTNLPGDSCMWEQTSPGKSVLSSEESHAVRPQSSTCTSPKKYPASPADLLSYPPSTGDALRNQTFPCIFSWENDPCMSAHRTPPANRAAMARLLIASGEGEGEGEGEGADALASADAVSDEASSPAVGFSVGLPPAGVNLADSSLTPPPLLMQLSAAVALTQPDSMEVFGVTAGEEKTVRGTPPASVKRQPTSPHHSYTTDSVGCRQALGASLTTKCGAANLHHGAAEASTYSSATHTQMRVEKQRFVTREIRCEDDLIVNLTTATTSFSLSNGGDGGINSNIVNGTSSTVDPNASSDVSASPGRDREASPSPALTTNDPQNPRIPIAVTEAERPTTPKRVESSNANAAATDYSRVSPSQPEHMESLKACIDTLVVSICATPSAQGIVDGGNAAHCISIATRSSAADLTSGAPPPPTSTAASSNCEVERGKSHDEEPAEANKVPEKSQVQCSSKDEPLLESNGANLARRYSLKNIGHPSDEDNAASGAPATRTEPPTAHHVLVAGDHLSPHHRNSRFPQPLTASNVKENETSIPHENSAETRSHNARMNGLTAVGGEDGKCASCSNGHDGELSSPSPSLSTQREAQADMTTTTSAAGPKTLSSLGSLSKRGGANAGVEPYPLHGIVAKRDVSGTGSAGVAPNGAVYKSRVTNVASGHWSTPENVEQQSQRLSTSSLCDSLPTATVGDGITPASRSPHRDTQQTFFNVHNGNDLPNSSNAFGKSPSADLLVGLANQRARDVVLGGETQPRKKSTVNALTRHVTFADSATTRYVEPPALPWADNDCFFLPDFSHMEYKDEEEEDPSAQQHQKEGEEHRHLADVSLLDEEEREVLRSVPPFRFLLGSRHAKIPSQLSSAVAQLRAPDWEVGPGQSDGTESEPNTLEKTKNASENWGVGVAHPQTEAEEKAQRVFFTKERLASRAALMQSRRADLQAGVSADNTTSVCAPCLIPAPGEHPVFFFRPPPAASVSPASVAPNPVSTQCDTKMPQTRPPLSPQDDTNTLTNVNEDDGFGEWVQPQQHTDSAQPLPATASPIASQPLTRERCIQLLSFFDKRGDFVPKSTVSLAVDAGAVLNILHHVFCDAVATPTSLCDESIPPDAPQESVPGNGAAPDGLSVSDGSLNTVKRVLRTLGFTPLANRATVTSPISDKAIGLQAARAPHSPRPSFLSGVGSATLTEASSPTDDKGTIQSVGHITPRTSPEKATPEEAHFEDGEEASMRLTRERLFPVSAHLFGNQGRNTATSPVASFLGSRRLQHITTAADWTENDVLLVIVQEELRIAQEKGSVIGKERLEDVLKAARS